MQFEQWLLQFCKLEHHLLMHTKSSSHVQENARITFLFQGKKQGRSAVWNVQDVPSHIVHPYRVFQRAIVLVISTNENTCTASVSYHAMP